MSTVSTWADGFGAWYTAVPVDCANPRRRAREAIRRELAARGELHQGYAVRVEPVPPVLEREGYAVFREVVDVREPRGWDLNMRAAGYR